MDMELALSMIISLSIILFVYAIYSIINNIIENKNNRIAFLNLKLKEQENKLEELVIKNQNLIVELSELKNDNKNLKNAFTNKVEGMQHITNQLQERLEVLTPKKAHYLPY